MWRKNAMNRPIRMIAVLMGVSLLACSSLKSVTAPSQNLVMTGNPKVPAAQGNAKVRTTDDGNTQINLDLKHMAAPDKIKDDATVYVLWAQDLKNDNSTPQNLGAIKVDADE